MMEVAAKLKGARISAQKARLVADEVRGMPVGEALNLLEFSKKKAAHLVRKLLNSAIANAENNEGADVDELRVATIFVDEGFGSLDEEALDLAVDTLMDLRESGRLVGVISHVGEMKERIDAQLVVSSDRQLGASAEFRLP